MIKKITLIFALLLIAPAAFAVNREELNTEFFTRFNDDCLNYYINTALNNNHNAKQATAKVEQYRQQVKYSLGAELPSFSVSSNYLGVHVPKLDNFQLSQNAFVLPFIMNYEADFLLKNRDKTRSAKKNYEAIQYEEKAVYLALLSDVATVYTNILEYDELIKNQTQLVRNSHALFNFDSKKFQRGIIDSTQLNNSRKNLQTAENDLESLCKQREVLLMQLAVLTGDSPNCVKNLHRGKLTTFEYGQTIPNEMDSDVIFARPDVMSAEKMLEKAKIDIRVARKEFLPTFNITGVWIFNTIAPGNFFSWESSLAAIFAGATQDIFRGGRKIANLKMQKAKYEELFEKYKETDLEAVKEVNTSLCFIKHDTNIDNNTKSKLVSEIQNFNDSQKKYKRGVISAPEYINAQSKVLLQNNEAAQTKTQRLVNYFTLYKAVGGKL